MRRFYGVNARSHGVEAIEASVRLLKTRLSPDRTRDEEIQDRQNAFEWSRKHIFRPHQHFTYDPCSWSRPLEEKVKAKKRLALVERLHMLEQSEREAARSIDNGRGRKEEEEEELRDSGEAAADMDYFYSIQDAAPPSIPLQQMLERLNTLQVLLTAPRHTNTALVTVERLQREYRHVLLLVFDRVCAAAVGETITFDALIYSWFLLMEGAESLLEVILNGKEDEEGTLQAVRSVRTALDTLLLATVKRVNAPTDEAMVLEGWIELLDVVTHPFIWRSNTLVTSSLPSTPVAVDTAKGALISGIYKHTISALAERMIASDTAGARTETLDPQHLHALLRSIARGCLVEADEADLRRASLLTRKVAEGIVSTLRGAVAPPLSHSLRLALLGKTARRVTFAATSDRSNEEEHQHHNQAGDDGRDDVAKRPPHVVMDVCGPPRGIVDPPTAADDARLITRACMMLLRRTADASVNTRLKAIEAADMVLLLLSYTPNYDLSIGDTVEFACELLEGSLQSIDANVVERQMRLLLLLSRLQLSMCNKSDALCNLLFRLCSSLAPPLASRSSTQRECKRLRGLVMHQLLHLVRVEELQQCFTQSANAQDTWEERLAFGQYSGALPLSLWREACRVRFAAMVPLSLACARALIILRTRCKSSGNISPPAMGQLSPTTAQSLDFESVYLLAQLLQVLLGDRVRVENLIVNPAAWDEAREATDGDRAVLLLLQCAKLSVQERCVASRLVTTFS